MIEKKINIPKEIIKKGLLKSLKYTTLIENIKGSFALCSFFLIGITFVDFVTGNSNLVFLHILSCFVISCLMSIKFFYEWISEVKNETEDFIYSVKLDELGVHIKNDEYLVKWEEYLYFIEYEDYLLIKIKDSGVSFLPKTLELTDVIEYTKKKVPEKKA
ncbi:MAG: hypothetical protein HRU38_22365 [Saccharospirillaceae bacterium]|nr:hypothetical protein [Pseudomonadales bacterium]NRB81372.1 hypothetical protein [Saccharospirillaceae bacterium]